MNKSYTDVINDLFNKLSDNEEALNILGELVGLLGQYNITPLHNTLIACHRCGNISATGYVLRRLGTKYVLLCCEPNGSGCIGKEVTPMCCFIDREGINCDQLASHYIGNGEPDSPGVVTSCIFHIGALIKDAEENKITRIS